MNTITQVPEKAMLLLLTSGYVASRIYLYLIVRQPQCSCRFYLVNSLPYQQDQTTKPYQRRSIKRKLENKIILHVAIVR